MCVVACGGGGLFGGAHGFWNLGIIFGEGGSLPLGGGPFGGGCFIGGGFGGRLIIGGGGGGGGGGGPGVGGGGYGVSGAFAFVSGGADGFAFGIETGGGLSVCPVAG